MFATVQHYRIHRQRCCTRGKLRAALFVYLAISHKRQARRSSPNHRTPTELNTEAHALVTNVDRDGTSPLADRDTIAYPWSSTGSSVRFAVHGGPANVAKG